MTQVGPAGTIRADGRKLRQAKGGVSHRRSIDVREGFSMPHYPRRFTSLDGMALVAAVAAGFALLRITWSGFWPTNGYSWPSAGVPATARAYIDAATRQALGAGPPMAICLTFGYFAVRLRGARPPLRRLARQPGTVACLAAIPCLVMLSAAYVVVNAIPGRILAFWYAILVLTYLIGPAVAGAWFTLGVSGRLQAPRDWIEGLGAAIGGCWIVLTLLALYSLRR